MRTSRGSADNFTQAAWDLSPEPVLLVDGRLRLCAVNAAARALPLALGREGAPLLDAVAPADRTRVGQCLRASLPAAGSAPVLLLANLASPAAPGTSLRCEWRVGAWGPGPGGRPVRALALRLLDQADARDQLHHRILETVDSGIVWYDADLRIVDANRTARHLLGFQDAEGARFPADGLQWQMRDERHQPVAREASPVWRARHGQQPVVTAVVALDRPAAGPRWLRVQAIPVPSLGPQGGPGVVVSFTDITEQRQAMRSLRDTEQLLLQFGEHAADVLWITGPDGRQMRFVSAAFERWWGLPRQALEAAPGCWLEAVPRAQQAAMRRAIATVRRRGEAAFEFDVQAPGQPARALRVRAFRILDPQGQTRYLAGLAEDVTALRGAAQREALHRQTQQRLERLVATAPGAVFAWRPAARGPGALIYASPSVGHVLGCGADDLLAGRVPLFAHVLPDDRPALLRSLARAARSGEAWRAVARLRRPDDGREVWIEAHAAPADEADGTRVWHGFLTDVSERQADEVRMRALQADLERRVAARTSELQARQREMEAFTYSVSHDLKAPLRGIDGYSRLLETDHAAQLGDEGRFFVTTIRKASAHMGQLIDDLLAYSRVERGRPVLGAFDPLPLLRGLVRQREAEVRAAGGQLRLLLPPGIDPPDPQVPPLACIGEREGLEIVLRNLIDNAIKFSAGVAAREVSLSARMTADGLDLQVRDNGSGFDMRYHDRIFEIFQRLHRAEDVAGTGVGLALVRKAVERMHGRVWAESAPGQGACFHVLLPAPAPASAAAPLPGPAASATDAAIAAAVAAETGAAFRRAVAPAPASSTSSTSPSSSHGLAATRGAAAHDPPA